ncbi:DUF3267 domain-containing protein [Oceanirhabdus sp. W0125-5]|uniref:DUF3267 domain-containing protein n=1 Tax=Oceanirhabdus sp. W0125-5 TaxID=2999116 RepID=UPI0022F33A59|nr:DUF3267 domain-containing protein [Oceanirhabdus sp. W0125-5]WBW96027.1 DUF3267 domain-containing protein [Oceanirhabdus sp. W0125-5]
MKLKWKGRLTESNTFPTTEVPSNSVQFLEPKSKLESYIAIVPILFFAIGCFYVKSNFLGELKLNLHGFIIGLLLTIPFLIIHELLHAVLFPPKSTVEIFYSTYGLSVVTCEPIPKLRYIFSLLLPALLLGVIPLLIWIFIPTNNATLNSLWFILCIGNLGSTTADLSNLFHALKEMPKGSVLQISGLKCYYY